jgi:hypothetical protein
MVAGAVVGAAVVGAAGSAIAGSEAAGATNKASNAAIAEQQRALDQQAQLSQPYRDLGSSAISKYQDLLGLGKGGNAAIESTLQSLPGYQFARDQGLQSTTNQATAMGLGLSGNTLQALDKYSTGLADQTYGEQVNRMLQPIQIGQAAAAGQAANVGTAASNIGTIGINQGNTNAGIDANTIAGITKAAGNGINNYQTMQTLNNLNNTGSGNIPGYNVATTPTYDPTSQTYTGGGWG